MGLEVEKAQSENRDAWVELFEAPLKRPKGSACGMSAVCFAVLDGLSQFSMAHRQVHERCAQTAKEFIEAQQTELPLPRRWSRPWYIMDRENTESYFMGGELRKIDDENAVKEPSSDRNLWPAICARCEILAFNNQSEERQTRSGKAAQNMADSRSRRQELVELKHVQPKEAQRISATKN